MSLKLSCKMRGFKPRLSISKPGALRGSKEVGLKIFRSDNAKIYLSLGSNIKPEENLSKAKELF